MDIPQPPHDEDLKNIIEKLAVFVARNGHEFEAMTKQKQQGNPRFDFLFGGEHYNYYMYRVTAEQSLLKHKAHVQQQRQAQGQMGMGINSGPGNMGMNAGQGNMGVNQGQNPFGGGPGPNFRDQPPQNFGGPQQQNFGPPVHQQQQRFPSIPSLFDQQPTLNQPPRPHMSRFDRGPGGQHMPHFERPPMRMPFQQNQMQPTSFDNFSAPAGTFERGPPSLLGSGGVTGEVPPRGFEFNQQSGAPGAAAGGPTGFESRGPPSGPVGFENRGPSGGSVGFENRGPSGGSVGFENRGPSGGPVGFENRGPSSSAVGFENRVGGGPPGGFENRGPKGFSQNFQQQPNQRIPPHSNISPSPVPPAASTPPSVNISAEMETLKSQKQALEEQIKQSEQNLAGQQQVLMTQQQQQIDESIRILQDAEIKTLAAELNIDLIELDNVLQPIVDSCTKDAISGGKAWIFTHTSTPRHYQLLSLYLLRKTTDPEASFCKRLHIIYLVNDVLHHCMRKGAEDLQQVLEAMVIPMYCHAKVKETGNEENLTKLNKLLNLWESKSQYVSPVAVDKLRDASNTWLEYHEELLKRHSVVVGQIAQNMQKTYEGYQGQHQIFCQHVLQNIKTIEQQMQQLLVQQQLQLVQQQQQQQQQMNFRMGVSATGGGPPPGMPNIPPPGLVIPGSQPPLIPGIPTSSANIPITTGYPGQMVPTSGTGFMQNPPNQLSQPPPGIDQPNVPIPDISRPPPGFPPPISEKELMPALPYYELPAGLMVHLVKPEDDNYKPIDPKAIRLPPPCPPSDRLLQAVEAFYGPPSHERPRDSEGWERLGLYEYFKSKNLARKQKEDDIREGRREKSRSPSPIRRDSSPCGRSPPRRRYQSKSPTPTRRRRSRSRSPSSRRKSRRRSRSKSRSPIRRSPTPPSFGMAGLGMEVKLDESNKGHQLLKKMGWGGSGLGANEQGIEAPISGGEVRERKDLYKGVGVSVNDPFESYRKSKGQAFVERMRQRAEDRP